MLVPGSMISNYRVEALIGKGGMGEVYKGFDTALNRPVAIKALNPELTTDADFVQRFRNEAKIQASLNHPNIVSLYTLSEEFGTFYMILEYASGDTLRELIARIGPIPEKRALNILSQVLSALSLAHSHGIIHRDIKPTNIVVGANDQVKILDFGIARLIGDKGLTKTGQNVGTVYYMSPEQVRAEKDLDGRSDIFSLGVTFFEMLAGRVPYNVETASDYAIMDEIVKEPVPDPRKYYEFISDNSVRVLRTMVAKDREQRFGSCDEVLQALQGDFRLPEPQVFEAHLAAPQPYSAAGPEIQAGPPPKTYMAEAILVTLFCCMPFGVAAIVNAAQASSAIKLGDLEKARAAAIKAKSFVNTSFWLGLVFGIISIIINLSSS